MLCGEPIPGIDAPGRQLQTQTDALGWNIDDLLVTGVAESGEAPHLAVSCKSSVQVTSSGLPRDFVAAAWEQWRKAGPMCRGSDCLALVTRGRKSAFEATWSDIKIWCDGGDAALAIARINATAKHKKVFASVKAPGERAGSSVSDEDVVALISHLHVFPLDFQLAHSETKTHAIMRCRGILLRGRLEEARKLWAREHLHRDEENVAGFCGFLASDAGAPLRLDGIQWLVAALHDETRATHWHRAGTGNALTELLNVILSEDAEKVSKIPKARDALVSLAADLVARQVPAALALQEQIQQIR